MIKKGYLHTISILITCIMLPVVFSSCKLSGLYNQNNNTLKGISIEEVKNKLPDTDISQNLSYYSDNLKTPEKPNDFDLPNNALKTGVKAKALYLTGWTAGSNAELEKYIQLANNTEVNSFVIDIKDDDGYVAYESSLDEIRNISAWKPKYDADKVLKKMHDNGIYVIGRLVCFNDPVFSSKFTAYAQKNNDGTLYRDRRGHTWIDPCKKEAWPYIMKIANEAIKKGFDEIQFDYVRFPNEGNKLNINYGDNGSNKYEIINEFLNYAKVEIKGVPVSADIFGITCESPEDTEGIGQYLEKIGMRIDYICPMVYPSHYAAGQIINGMKFEKPDLLPYQVVRQSLIKARERINKVNGYNAHVRPYLQAFTASWLGRPYYQHYGADQIRQEIDAVYDAGYDEWILWDPANRYPTEAFKK